MLREQTQTLLAIQRALTVVGTSAVMGERMLSLTHAENDNGPCSPRSSTGQLLGSTWLQLAFSITSGNRQLILSSPQGAERTDAVNTN